MSAMPQEQEGLIAHMTRIKVKTRAQREYVYGRLWNIDCVCVLSRIGKVAAATTATSLIEHFGVTHILFTGVAGAAAPTVKVGDIVVADRLIQHDLDCSPLFPRFEIPLTGRTHLHADAGMTEKLIQSITGFFHQELEQVIDEEDRESFQIAEPRVHTGLIASGDEFINCSQRMKQLKKDLPEVLAVEMEGAAVAQVCQEFGIPFAIMRTISDGANEDSPVDFMQFIERIAADYAFHVVRRWCEQHAAVSAA
jgi:adenosylhomocysteine nucleosidase